MAAAKGALVLGKQNVGISQIEPVGNYALRLFSTTDITRACIPGRCCTSSARNTASIGAATCSAALRPLSPRNRGLKS